MKILSIIFALLLANAIVATEKISVPNWVPKHKHAAFMKYIEKTNKVAKIAENCSRVLKSKPVVTSCKITEERQVQYVVARHDLESIIQVNYNRKVAECKYEDNTVDIELENPDHYGFWQKARDGVIIGGLLFVVGYLVGKFAK